MFEIVHDIVSTYSTIDTRYCDADKKPIKKWTLMLPGAGCEYWKKSGGCTMCGFSNSTQKYTKGFLYPSIVFKMLYRLAERSTLAVSPKHLSIFNGGSFFNDRELPSMFQEYIYKRISSNQTVKNLFVESRCEYIHEPKILEAMSLLDGKSFTVGIGLESHDDSIRNSVIKKGLSKKVFEEKVALLRNNGVDVLAYIFLKPIGLQEKDAFEEVIKTIDYAFSVGVTEVALSSAFIQPNTKMAVSYDNGEFKPPYLWTILEIIREIERKGLNVSIGGFTDEPPPVAIPANCPDCSPLIYDAIEEFRQTRHLGIIPDCSCKKQWELQFN